MRTLNEVIKAIEICKNPDINRSCKDCPMPDDQMCINYLLEDALQYLKWYKELADNSEAFAEWKENPPLTWDELCRIDMIGEPVWNSATRRWMLLIDSANDNTWIDLVNHAGGVEHWIEHDLRKAPLYRKVNDAG